MTLRNTDVVVLAGDGFEEMEFWYPVLRLREAGANVTVLGVSSADLEVGRCGYPVVPDAALSGYSGRPSIVVVPGVAESAADELASAVAPRLKGWSADGVRIVATSTAVAALAAAGILEGTTVSCPASAEDAVRATGAIVGAGAVSVSDSVATARSVDDVVELFQELRARWDLGGPPALAEARVAVLCENQYQELELWYPLLRLREEGATAYTVGPKAGAMYVSKLGYPVVTDLAAGDVDAADFDAVVIPGGHSPEGMRKSQALLGFVRAMDERGAIVSAICHAGWVLASAGIAKGRHLTCVSIIKDDVIHAGGDYVTQEVVRDGNLITSRLPSDLPVFAATVVQAVVEAPKAGTEASYPLPHSQPSYDTAARLVPLAVGVASANYTQISAPVGN